MRKFRPLFDRVLVKRLLPETVSPQIGCKIHLICCVYFFYIQKTKGGIMIPEKAQGKVNEATVVAIGPGARDRVIADLTNPNFFGGDKIQKNVGHLEQIHN